MRQEIRQPVGIDEQDDNQQVQNDRKPDGFALAGAGKVVLKLDEEMRYGGRVEAAIGRFPMLGILKLCYTALHRCSGQMQELLACMCSRPVAGSTCYATAR